MTTTTQPEHDTHRGHPMVRDGSVWRYCDNGQPVSDNPNRACGHCGKANTADGHDGCLGTIPDATNACWCSCD